MKNDALFSPHYQGPWDEVGGRQKEKSPPALLYRVVLVSWSCQLMWLILQNGSCIWSRTPPPPMGNTSPSRPSFKQWKKWKNMNQVKQAQFDAAFSTPLAWMTHDASELRSLVPWQLVVASLTAGPVLSHCKALARGCFWLLVWVCCHSCSAFANSGFSNLWGSDVFKTRTWQDIGHANGSTAQSWSHLAVCQSVKWTNGTKSTSLF